MVKLFTSHLNKSPESYPLSMNEREISSSENRNIQVDDKYVGSNNER